MQRLLHLEADQIGGRLLLGILLLASLSQACSGTEEEATHRAQDGFVVDLNGKWALVSPPGENPEQCSGVGVLERGELVPTGCLFSPADPNPGFFVKIARWDGTVEEIRCETKGSCGQPQSLSIATVDPDSLLSRLASAGARLFSKQPKRYVATLSRGTQLRDAVLELDGTALDLSSAFADAPSDSYLVTLQPIAEVGPKGNPVSVQYIWTGEARADPVHADLSPGLYALRVAADAGSLECWVLLAAPSEVDEQRAQFAQIEQMASDWKRSAGITEGTRRALLRAALDELARG